MDLKSRKTPESDKGNSGLFVLFCQTGLWETGSNVDLDAENRLMFTSKACSRSD